MLTRFQPTAAACLALLLFGSFAAVATAQNHPFQIAISSTIDVDIQNMKQKVDAETEVNYNWTRSGAERVLKIDSMFVKATANGTPIMNTFMNRTKLANTTAAGATDEVPYEAAPEELKTMLKDSFDTPICKIEVNASGAETKRTVVAEEGAKSLLDNGIIENAVLFHPPFAPNDDQWQSDAAVSMGNGGYAKGKLTYTKAAGGNGGQLVKVAGTLTNEGFQQPGTPLSLKNAKYVVSGEQTYDPARKEWVAGKLKMDVSYAMTVNNNDVGTAAGVMNVTFKHRADESK